MQTQASARGPAAVQREGVKLCAEEALSRTSDRQGLVWYVKLPNQKTLNFKQRRKNSKKGKLQSMKLNCQHIIKSDKKKF